MALYKIIYLSIISLGILTGVLQWKKITTSCKYALLLLVITLTFELIASYFGKRYRNNLWVYHCLIPIQFVLITLCFWSELKLQIQKFALIIVPITFILISIFVQFDKFPSYSINISFTLYVLWSLLYFRALLINTSQYSVSSYPLFWISCGWLQFCILNLMQLGLFNTIILDNTFEVIFDNIRIGSNYLLYACYLLAFLSQQKSLAQSDKR
jgi:hypothetical protein